MAFLQCHRRPESLKGLQNEAENKGEDGGGRKISSKNERNFFLPPPTTKEPHSNKALHLRANVVFVLLNRWRWAHRCMSHSKNTTKFEFKRKLPHGF